MDTPVVPETGGRRRTGRPVPGVRVLALAATVVTLGTSVAGAQGAGRTGPDGYTDAQRPRVTPIVELVRKHRDAVVNIAATQVVTVRDPFLDFFDTPYARQMKTSSVGSGAVIHPAGYVLTNAHVVAQASELKVIFADGTELPAQVVAALTEHDLAVVRVLSPKPLPAIALGRSNDLMVGEAVVAIGNPLGLQHTVTTGIISALGRELPAGDVVLRDVVQTDAAINPGNSGGPLLNVLGQLVGVNTAIRGDAQNVGFAIPVDRVRARLPELLGVQTRGRVRFGVLWGDEVAGQPGVQVAGVEAGSPAERAKVRAGQFVTSIGGRPVKTLIDALVWSLDQPVGRPFSMGVAEGGAERELKVSLEEVPKPDGGKLAQERFGLKLEPMDRDASRRLRLRSGTGLRVSAVQRGAPAARAGLQVDDLITQVGQYGVNELDTLGLLLEDVKPGADVVVVVVRVRGTTVYRNAVVLDAR